MNQTINRGKALDAEFVAKWNGNATDTARRCGISDSAARVRGCRLKKRNKVAIDLKETAGLRGVVKGEEQAVAAMSKKVAITRNGIINGLAAIAEHGESEAARVSAYGKLADIFQLTAKAAKEDDPFVGWTDDELEAFRSKGTIPPRFGVIDAGVLQ